MRAPKGYAFFVEYWWKGHEDTPHAFWTREYKRLSGIYSFREGFAAKITFPNGGNEAEMIGEKFEPDPIDRTLQGLVIKKDREPVWLSASIPLIFSCTSKRLESEPPSQISSEH